MSTRPPLAFFDFDGTLTTRDSLMPFLRYVAGTPRYCLQMASVSPVLIAYLTGLLANDRAKGKVLRHCLGGRDTRWLAQQGEAFSQSHLPRLLRTQGMEHLRWHQQRGHECVLVSASLDLYLAPWSQAAGFDHCLSSSLVNRNGICTGDLNGANCYGPEKLRRIRDAFPDVSKRETFAYGDSAGDTDMLAASDHAFIWQRGAFKPC